MKTMDKDTHHINGICCDVHNCKYNDDRCCTAREIHVGPDYAACCNDTICTTFKECKECKDSYPESPAF